VTTTENDSPSRSEELIAGLVAQRLLGALADRCRAALDVTQWLIEAAAATYADIEDAAVPADEDALSPEEAFLLHRHAEMAALRDGLGS
jgi:hypothetical protein